jgi:hypothetical protein
MYNLQLVLGLGVRRGRWCVCVCGSEGGSVVVVDLGVVVTCWFGLLRPDRVRFSVGTSLFDSPSVGSIVFGMDSRRSCTRRVGAGQQQRQQSPLNYNFSRYPASPLGSILTAPQIDLHSVAVSNDPLATRLMSSVQLNAVSESIREDLWLYVLRRVLEEAREDRQSRTNPTLEHPWDHFHWATTRGQPEGIHTSPRTLPN